MDLAATSLGCLRQNQTMLETDRCSSRTGSAGNNTPQLLSLGLVEVAAEGLASNPLRRVRVHLFFLLAPQLVPHHGKRLGAEAIGISNGFLALAQRALGLPRTARVHLVCLLLCLAHADFA